MAVEPSGSAVTEVPFHSVSGIFIKENYPFLVALTGYSDYSVRYVDLLCLQIDEFAYSHAGSVYRLQKQSLKSFIFISIIEAVQKIIYLFFIQKGRQMILVYLHSKIRCRIINVEVQKQIFVQTLYG